MASSFGTQLRVQLFGQSHSEAVGCVVEGLPAGFSLDTDELASFMARRAPGKNAWSTPRKELDYVRILSGLNDRGVTCGTPLALTIANTNTRSRDYEELRRVPRPGHADLTAWHKWAEAHDIRGGGHFSARLTAPLCAAGGIALQYLEKRGVRVAAHVYRIGSIYDEPLCADDNSPEANAHLKEQMDELANSRGFPTIDPGTGIRMANYIDEIRREKDSVGGVVECVAVGMPAGVGGPRYDGVQGAIARIIFGIPAVRGLEFGAGFSVGALLGSQDNDPFEMRDGVPVPVTNNAGGTLGGITTGAPVLFRMAVKPTPSIAQPQQSVDLVDKSNAVLEVRGRHDPCVAPRAVPVAEAAMALALLDSWLAFPPSDGNW
ncbi:MAG: chorismate synthase [Coriobacteriales bacterium]|nr:chorismate synthase [Coriobacteriales bacterium]